MNIIRIEKIIDDYIYPDISSIIKSYLITKCKMCNRRILEDEGYETYDDLYYCLDCRVLDIIKKCEECKKCYNFMESHNDCPLCFLSCFLFCKKCCNEMYDTNENTGTHIRNCLINQIDMIINISDEDLDITELTI